MERREKKEKDNVGLYKGQCGCESASTKGYMAHFGLQKCPKNLKGITKKRQTAEFRKRISAKTAVFLVFKSVNEVNKSDDTKT